MAIDINRLKPNRTTLIALVGALFAVSMGAARDFVWADLREGFVRTDSLPRMTRALVRVGFLLLLLCVGVMVFNDVLRGASPLVAAVGGTAGRGVLVPTILLPFTLFMIAVAWSFLLTGALHSHPALRVAAVFAYLGTTVGWMSGALFNSGYLVVVAWAAMGAVVVFFGVRWRGVLRPSLEFPILLSLIGLTYAIGHAQLLATYQVSGIPLFLQTLEASIIQLGILVTPLLVMIGLDIADFAYRAGTWTVGVVSSRLGKVALGIAVALGIGWQLRHVIVDASARLADGAALGYVGAVGMPILVAVALFVVMRLDRDVADDDRSEGAVVDIASRNAPRLAFGFFGWQMILTVGTFVALGAVAIADVSGAALIQQLTGLIGRLTSEGQPIWRVVFDVAVAVIGLVVARRGRHVIGLYLVLVGALDGWIYLTEGPLAALNWETRLPVTFWWVTIIAAVAAFLLVRGKMTVARAEGLLLITVMTILAGGAEAVEDPFSPLFAFAATGLIAFGIVWDSITVGTWANEDSAALPRANRMLLYLGYVLFSVTVINWALTTHDLSDIEFFTNGVSSIGFQQFGVPLVYALYGLVLLRVLRPPAEPAPSSVPAGEPAAT